MPTWSYSPWTKSSWPSSNRAMRWAICRASRFVTCVPGTAVPRPSIASVTVGAPPAEQESEGPMTDHAGVCHAGLFGELQCLGRRKGSPDRNRAVLVDHRRACQDTGHELRDAVMQPPATKVIDQDEAAGSLFHF